MYFGSIGNRSLHDQYRLSIFCFLRHKNIWQPPETVSQTVSAYHNGLEVRSYIHLTIGAITLP